MIRFFSGLRGKLILTYTLVTVLALLALEVLVLSGSAFLTSLSSGDEREYFDDVIQNLVPQARTFLLPGQEDLTGLQTWLEDLHDLGYASPPPQYAFDSPAAAIVQEDPIYLLSPEGIVLAQAPAGSQPDLVGRPYTPPSTRAAQDLVSNALDGGYDVLDLTASIAPGRNLIAVPVTESGRGTPIIGILVLTVAPPPVMLVSAGPTLLTWIFWTALVLLCGVAPFGAIFGLIMSRGLTHRLRALTAAADAWSEGDFRPVPTDRSRDEIGYLGMRLRRMAERVQDLMNSQKALAMLEERNRLARELHDTVKQQNFATLMQVRAARNLLERDPAAASQHLAEAETLIKASQQEMGRMIAELRPAALDEQGLSGALQQYLNTWSQTSSIPVDFQVWDERSLPIELEQALYRITQEALANVARHSRASAAHVQLKYEPHQVCLVVSDNGQGFDLQQAGEGGYGLRSIRERLAAFNGWLELHSASGEGATLTATVPLAGADTKDGKTMPNHLKSS